MPVIAKALKGDRRERERAEENCAREALLMIQPHNTWNVYVAKINEGEQVNNKFFDERKKRRHMSSNEHSQWRNLVCVCAVKSGPTSR